jgi:DNA-binding transcriptional regulator YiaG
MGAGDRDLAGLKGLAQAVQRLGLELRKFVEKQHAVMGQRDFARPGLRAPAHKRGHGGGMMGRAEGPRECTAPAMRYSEIEGLLIPLIRDVNFDMAVNGSEWEVELNRLKSAKIDCEKGALSLSEKINRVVDAIAEIPESTDLRVKLRSLGEQREIVIETKRKIEATIADLSMSSTEDRAQLLRRINDNNLSEIDKIHLRKKVNAEIRRFIRVIKVSPQLVNPWENQLVSTSSHAELFVEVGIEYRNGSWHYFHQNDGTDMYGISNERQKLMLQKTLIDRMDSGIRTVVN